MTAYYNEIDPYAAQWLRNLITAGHIAPGDVDTRSIEDVTPYELRGYTQCHFFAGIGGWSLALRLAGISDDTPIWTGSCPCQPFSAAGKGVGFDDERHLWPAWQHLIAERRPPVIFGEQVASKAAAAWIDLVHADMEGLGYAFGCVPFPAAGIGAPHIRDRNYWVAHTAGAGQQWGWAGQAGYGRNTARLELERLCDVGGLGNTNDTGSQGLAGHGGAAGREEPRGSAAAPGLSGGLGHSNDPRICGQPGGFDSPKSGVGDRSHLHDPVAAGDDDRAGPTNGGWRDADWLQCRDGKWRPVEPGTFPLAHGVPGRVGRLRAYGNAIIPAQAAEFIRAALG